MSNIRKEYKEYKQITKELWEADVLSWTEQNVILINERLNRNAVYRLNSAIQRFDNKFGPYREKLPAIADILNNAENGLYQVVTGNVSPRAAAKMLERLSIIYNILSNFFGGDLGALLKTPAFRMANEKADEKIDKIIDKGHDIAAIRRSMAAALKPDENERRIFRKAYKTFEMPNLDWNMAAKQLCRLSCNELRDLAGMPTVPMVVVDKDLSEKNDSVNGEGLDEQGLGLGAMYYGAQAANAIGSAVGTVGSALGTAATTAGGFLAGAGAAAAPIAIPGALVGGTAYLLYKKFKNVSDQMAAAIANLQKLVSSLDGFENINAALGKLRTAALAAGNGMKSDKSLQGIRGWMRHPTLTILKQTERVIAAFKAVTEVWNKQIKTLYAGKGFRSEDIPKIKEMLEKAVKGGYLKRGWKFLTGVREFPGLSDQDIVDAVVELAKRGIAEAPEREEEKGAAQTSTGTSESTLREAHIIQRTNKINMLFEEIHDVSEAMLLSEDYADLERFVAQFVAWDNSNKADDQAKKAIENLNKVAASAKGNNPPDPKLVNQLFGGPSGGAQGAGGMMPGMMPVMPMMMGGRVGGVGGAQAQTAVPYPATPAAAPQAVANVKAEADAAAQADPDFDPEDVNNLQKSIGIIEQKANDPLDKTIIEDLNRQINSYGVQAIPDYRAAITYLKQYQQFLTRAADYNAAVASIINFLSMNPEQRAAAAATTTVPSSTPVVENRQQLINKIKKLILEQVSARTPAESRSIIEQQLREEMQEVEGGGTGNPDPAQAPAGAPAPTVAPAGGAPATPPATGAPPAAVPNAGTTSPPQAAPPAGGGAAPAGSNTTTPTTTQTVPAANPNAAATAAPSTTAVSQTMPEVDNAPPIDRRTLNIFNDRVGKFLQSPDDNTKNLIDAYITRKSLGTNFDAFINTMKQYENVISNALNVKKIIILINKTANLLSKKQPKAAAPKKAATAGAANPPPATGTPSAPSGGNPPAGAPPAGGGP